MHMVGKTEVYSVAEIEEMGAIFAGYGERNVLMDAHSAFWTLPQSGQWFVSFVKGPACCMALEGPPVLRTTHQWIALGIRQEDVPASVMSKFVRRIRDTEKLYAKQSLRVT